MLAGLLPALRATRVPPIAAMREGVQIPPRPLPTRRTLIIRFAVYLVLVVAARIIVGGGLAVVLLVVVVARALRLWAASDGGGERPPRHYRVDPGARQRDRPGS